MQQAVPPPRSAAARLASGPQIHYTEQGDPGGEPIVFLPAYADSWFSYSRVLALLPTRYHAYALDQRVTLVGHSGSCFAARRVVVAHPERVARLILSGSPAGSLPTQVAAGLQAAVRSLADPVPADFVREFQAGATHLPLPETFLEGLVAESRKLPARVWRDAADGLAAFDDTADLGRIAAPTLLVWGDRDGLLPPHEQQRLVAAIPGARSQLYPETGHSPHWERPERFAADLEAFMGASS